MSDLSARLRNWLYASLFAAFLLILAASHLISQAGLLSAGLGAERLHEQVMDPAKPVLPQIREVGRLVVLTRNGPTTYYIDRDEPVGYEHDLASAFARHLGVAVEFRVLESTPALLEALGRGEGHLVAANLIAHDVPQTGAFMLGPAYANLRQQLVCHRKGVRPKSREALAETSIMVIADSSYEKRLSGLAADLPGLEWATIYNLSTEDLMQRVADRSIGCTVGDSTLVSINRRYYPELAVPFDLSGPEPMSWVMTEPAKALGAEMAEWFAREDTKELLKTLDERYYGHVPEYDYVDLTKFRKRIKKRLPTYRDAFEREANKRNLPWTLLAAVGYQESHWRPRAKSPTGVRGLMMLTRVTAKEVGVRNRLDAAQSIRGGAKYLAGLLKRVPESVQGEDRLWFALAAYNVGFGHMMDARALAERLGRNPDLWADLKATLPLLTQSAFYNTLTHGYARGNEPVRYVQRVRHYQDILERELGLSGWQEASLRRMRTKTDR